MKTPTFMPQINEYGTMEKVDVSIYNVRIVCKEVGCLNYRFVRSQDKHHVKMCKYHARLHTLQKRAQRAKAYRASLSSAGSK